MVDMEEYSSKVQNKYGIQQMGCLVCSAPK